MMAGPDDHDGGGSLPPDEDSPEASRASNLRVLRGGRSPDGIPPPHDLDVERCVVEAALSSEDDPARAEHLCQTISPADFYSEAHRRIWTAARSLVEAGRPLGLLALAASLRERGDFERVGGVEYIGGLAFSPATRGAPLDDAVVSLRDLAARRRIIATAQAIAAEGYSSRDQAGYLESSRARLEAALDTPDAPAPRGRTLADRMLELAVAEPPVRIATGLPTLDKATRGGPPVGRLVILAGAPGANKTGLAIKLLHDAEARGARAWFLAADQEPEHVLTRIGQREGLHRDDLDGVTGGDARRAAWTSLAHRAASMHLDVIDGSDPEGTVEALARRIRSSPDDGRARVVVVDSLQTVRCIAAEGLDERARLDVTLAAIKRLATREGALVILVSEMARGAYRSKLAAQNSESLSAAKGTGAIEYAADLMLALRSVKGEQDLVDVEVPKNRLGTPCPPFRLKLHFAQADATETDMPSEEDAELDARSVREAREAKTSSEVRARILAAVGKNARLTSKNRLFAVVGGRKSPVLVETERLLAERLLAFEDGVFRIVSTHEEEL